MTQSQEHSRLVIYVFGLVHRCPRPAAKGQCPLKNLRQLPLAEAEAAIQSMPRDQLARIIACHERCLKESRVDLEAVQA